MNLVPLAASKHPRIKKQTGQEKGTDARMFSVRCRPGVQTNQAMPNQDPSRMGQLSELRRFVAVVACVVAMMMSGGKHRTGEHHDE
jgi:hypothetical protein